MFCCDHPALRRFFVLTVMGAAALVAFGCNSLSAATLTWSASPAGNAWSAAANWGGTAPAASGDALVFNASSVTALTQDIPNLSVLGLTFNTTAPAFTVSLNQALTLTAGGSLTLASGGTATQTFAGTGPLRVGAGTSAANFVNNGSGALLVQTPVASASAPGGTLGLGGTGAGEVSSLISDGPGPLALTKSGTGTWTLKTANTYTGSTRVTGGTLVFDGAASSPASAAFSVGAGATLRWSDSSVGGIVASRLGTAPLTLAGGTFRLTNDAANIPYAPQVTRLELAAGTASTLATAQAGASGTATLTIGTLVRGAGSILLADLPGAGTTRNTVLLGNGSTHVVNGIIPWILDATGGAPLLYDATAGLRPVTAFQTGAPTAWTSTDHVRLTTGTTTLTGARSVASLTLAQAAATALDLGGSSLTLAPGPLLVTGNFASTLRNGTVALGASEGVISVAANTLTVSAALTGSGGLTKTGSGGLTLATTSLSGPVSVVAGTLTLGTGGSISNLTTTGGNLTFTGTPAATVGSLSGIGSASVVTVGTTAPVSLTLAPGSHVFNRFTFSGGTTAQSLTLNGTGATTTLAGLGLNASSAWTLTLAGGDWTTTAFAGNGGSPYGTFNLTGGASLRLGGSRFGLHGTWNVSDGSLVWPAGFSGEGGAGAGYQTTVSGQGAVTWEGSHSLASSVSTTPVSNFLRVQGGVATVLGNLTVGSSSAPSIETNEIALSGGKLFVTGTLAGAAPVDGRTNTVALTGGTLVTGTYNATNLGGALVNAGSTLAPGDVNAYGRLTVTGGLTLGSGTLAIEIGGTTPATSAFGAVNAHDTVAASGSVTLGGTLAVVVRSPYVPIAAQTFTILTGAGGIEGNFQNAIVNGTTRFATADGRGSFVVRKEGNTLVLSNYVDNFVPAITAAPVADQVQIGMPASLSVTATNPVAGTLAYQWFRNGAPVAGATASTLSLASATLANDGAYTVMVSNAHGSVTSTPVFLHVIGPVLLHYPMNQAPVAPSNVVLDQTGNTIGRIDATPFPVATPGGIPATGGGLDFSQTNAKLRIEPVNGGLRNFGNFKNAVGMTIAFWYKPNVPITAYNHQGTIAKLGKHFLIDFSYGDATGTTPRFNFGDGDTVPTLQISGSPRDGNPLADGQWHFYAVTVDYRNPLDANGVEAPNVITFLDGRHSGTRRAFRFVDSFQDAPGEVLTLGDQKQLWDNFIIFNYPLNPAEIAQLHAQGTLAAHAPQILARTSSERLLPPANQVSLSAELFHFGQTLPITTTWSVAKAPAGGAVTFAAPGSLATTATFNAVPGDYVLALTANNTAHTSTSYVAVSVFAAVPVQAFASVAGRPAADVLTGAPVTLNGASRVFESPNPSSASYLWTLLSGPAAPVFANPADPETSVSFTSAGTYVLQLAVSSGGTTATKTVTIRVADALMTGAHATASRQALLWPENTTTLQATVSQTQPSRPVTYAWSQAAGPGTATFASPAAASTPVTFSEPGVYALLLTASSSAGSADSRVWVKVWSPGPGNEAGILPPEPRRYSPQPPPYVHPRFFFTEADRPDLTWRAQNNPLTAAALARVRWNVRTTLDTPGNIHSDAYQRLRDVPGFSVRAVAFSGFYDRLAEAAYLAWLDQDLPRSREIGTVLAHALRDELNWNTDSSRVRTIGFIYDVTFNAMNEEQRVVCRAYLGPLTARPGNQVQFIDAVYGSAMAIYGEEGYNHAAALSNLERLRGAFESGAIATVQGWKQEDTAYGGFTGASINPGAHLYRQLEPLIVTGNIARENYMEFYQIFANTTATTGGGIGGHGEGGWALFGEQYLMHRYFYPADPLDDFVRNASLLGGRPGVDLYEAIFSVSPLSPSSTFASVAEARRFPLSKFDPRRGIGVARSDWGVDATHFDLDMRRGWGGHVHASVNELTLFGLQRNWLVNPGYGAFANELHSTILIDGVGSERNPARIADVIDREPITSFASDARHAYTYKGTEVPNEPNLGVPIATNWRDLRFAGSSDGVFPSSLDEDTADRPVRVKAFEGSPILHNPVQRAFRTASMIRGPRPYVLVWDDIQKDDLARAYHWVATVPSTVEARPGATTTEATLFHSGDGSAAGVPQLLVRVLSAQGTASPITVGSSTFNGRTARRVHVPRQAVAPDYRVLLFPHHNGDSLPTTQWTDNTLTVVIPGQSNDRFEFIQTADKRTRVLAFSRSQPGRAAPVVGTPTALVATANPATVSPITGQPGAVVNFTVTATSDTGATLVPELSSPSGTVFPAGESIVYVTAKDALGQLTTRNFTVTVLPAAPEVVIDSVANLAGATYGIRLSWSGVARATAYSVKRASRPEGPYTVLADRQLGFTFSQAGLPEENYFYVVTSWLQDREGPPSPVIPLVGGMGEFSANKLGGPSAGYGVHRSGDALLLSGTDGALGGNSDGGLQVATPWTGDGSFTVRLADLRAFGGGPSAFARHGLMLRASADANAIHATATYNTFFLPSTGLLTRVATGAGNTSGASLVSTTTAVPRPLWLRLQRSGNQISSFYSQDGTDWLPSVTPLSLAALPATALVGPYLGGGSGSVNHSVRYDNIVFLGTPGITVEPSSLRLDWQATVGRRFTVHRATAPDGPFTVVATDLPTPTFTDSAVTAGATYYYTVSTRAPLGGATTSPVVSRLFPLPVVAPSAVSVTPGLGNVTVSWTGSPANTAPTYSVQRAPSAGGPFTTIASGLAGTSYVDTGFANDGTYFYRIVAENGRNTATSATATTTPLAGVFIKADNATALDQAASWSPTARPGVADTLRWTGTYGVSSALANLGTGLAVAKIELLSPSRAIVIGASTGPLTVGTGGIDLSASAQNLTIDAPVTLVADQTWTVATGRILTLGGPLVSPAGRVLTLAGAGTLRNNRTDAHTLFGGVFSTNGGTLQLGTATTDLTLNAANLPAGSSNAFTLTGSAGSRLTIDAATTANVTLGGAFTGVHLRVRQGNVALSSSTPIGNLTLENGTVTTTATDRFQLNTAGQTFTMSGGTLDTRAGASGGLRFGSPNGGGGNGAQTVTVGQSSGTVFATSLNLGGNDTAATRSPGYTLSGGTLALSSNLSLGADAAGLGSSTFTLGGGTLSVPGTIAGVQGGARQVFAFSGGTLAAGALNATNLRSAAADPANGTFAQTGGVLAPGDLGTAGRTVITGNYTLAAAGTIALDVGGTTQANAFQAGAYDYVTVSGTTTLAGNLTVRLANGFTPANVTSFIVVNSTGALTGAFANAAFGTRVVTDDLRGSFLVSKTGNTVVLGGYQGQTAREGWRLRHFGATTATGLTADTADFDGDGVSNLLEYALDTSPTSAASVSIPIASTSQLKLQLTFLRARSDVTYVVEVSSNLSPGSWTPVATDPGTVGQSVTVIDTVNVSTATPPRRFLRLRIIAP